MPVDPQAQAVLDQIRASGAAPLHTLPVSEARAAAAAALRELGGEPEPVYSVADRSIPGPAGALPIRIYRPRPGIPLPVLLYFHGGGWTVCDLDTHENVCRGLANRAGCIVVAVDYRLGPEHKFPAAVEDCYAATGWVACNAASFGGDPARIAAGGDSAGGNLATVVAAMARQEGGPRLRFQLLVYPVADYLPATRSYHEFAEGYFLTREAMVWFFDAYLPERFDSADPRLSPLRAASLAGLPPALVMTAEYDPLRDEGEQYAARLKEAGVSVSLKRYAGMIHPFFSLAGVLDRTREAWDDAAAALLHAFSA